MVAPLVAAGLIGAGSSFLGGLFGRSAAKKQAAATDAFNRNKIQWTVEDAKKAGIAPLAALGSPVSGSWATPQADHSMGDAVSSAGRSLAQLPLAAGAATQNKLQAQLLQAQIGRTHAETANLVSEATSRSSAARFRAATLNNPNSLSVEDVALINRTHVPGEGSVDVRVGPDIDEMMTGAAIEKYAQIRNWGSRTRGKAYDRAIGRTRPKARSTTRYSRQRQRVRRSSGRGNFH